MAVTYYPIDEKAAEQANDLNSYRTYRDGEATAEYRAAVDRAAKIAEKQKKEVDPIYHEKIDQLLDTYARKLAENLNSGYRIDARVPSILIAGGSNFPKRKKEKQNAAWDKNLEEWQKIQGLIDKIRGVGTAGISADDPAAVQKLKLKLDRLKQDQENMKAVNAYYRKNKTLDGCPGLTWEQIETLKAGMARSFRPVPKPYESYMLTNNNAEIRRVEKRIEELTRVAETEFAGWEFEGGRAEINREANRLRLFFDDKPDADVRSELKSYGFRWAPSAGAWQRQLSEHVFSVADKLECIRPLSGKLPSQLQSELSANEAAVEKTPVEETPREAVPSPVRTTTNPLPKGWSIYIIPDLKTWSTNADKQSVLERFDTFEEAKARYEELRPRPYDSEAPKEAFRPQDRVGPPYARLTIGIENSDKKIVADILQVRGRLNCLVDDFTRMDTLKGDPEVMRLLQRFSEEIGFEDVMLYKSSERSSGFSRIPFENWDNPYFPSKTAGRIAALYYDVMRECYPGYANEFPDRDYAVERLALDLRGKGTYWVASDIVAIRKMENLPGDVKNRVSMLIAELADYIEKRDREKTTPEKPKRKKSRQQER